MALYSIRILHCGPPARTLTYTVPDGKRLVIKAVNYVQGNAAGGYVWLQVHGVTCWGRSLPVSFTGGSDAVRIVAYERETVALTTEGADTRVDLSGYLFDDPVGAPPAAAELPAEVYPDTPPTRPAEPR